MGHTTIDCTNYSPTLPDFNAWHGPRSSTSDTNRPRLDPTEFPPLRTENNTGKRQEETAQNHRDTATAAPTTQPMEVEKTPEPPNEQDSQQTSPNRGMHTEDQTANDNQHPNTEVELTTTKTTTNTTHETATTTNTDTDPQPPSQTQRESQPEHDKTPKYQLPSTTLPKKQHPAPEDTKTTQDTFPNGERPQETHPLTDQTKETDKDDPDGDESDSTLKGSDEEYDFDENEVFLIRSQRTKRDLNMSPNPTKKKPRRDLTVAPGRSRMFKLPP